MRGVSRHARRSFVPGRICDRGLEISRTTGRAVLIGGGWGRGANAFHRTPIKTTRADRSNRTNHQTLPRHRQKGPRQGVGHASITERGHRSFGGSRCNLLRALGSASLSTPPSPHRPGPPLPMASRAVMLGGEDAPLLEDDAGSSPRGAARRVSSRPTASAFGSRSASSPRSACSRGVASRGASVARIAGSLLLVAGAFAGAAAYAAGPVGRASALARAQDALAALGGASRDGPPSAPAVDPMEADARRPMSAYGVIDPDAPVMRDDESAEPPQRRARQPRRGPAEEPAEPARVPGADENLPEVEDLSSDASGSKEDLARTTRADAQAEVDAQIEEEMRKIEEATKREDEGRDTRGGARRRRDAKRTPTPTRTRTPTRTPPRPRRARISSRRAPRRGTSRTPPRPPPRILSPPPPSPPPPRRLRRPRSSPR